MFLFSLLLAILTTSGQQTGKTVATSSSNSTRTQITLDWNKTYQEIRGFGTFGGRILPFFESPKRDSVMEYLLGESGLKLNILRGKILHTYPFDKKNGNVTVKPAGVDITADLKGDVYKKLTTDQKEQLAQVWILKTAKERYHLPILFASAWTPPLYMKMDTTSISGKSFNGINKNFTADFANYMAGFTKAFQKEGIDFYAVSPTNEPDNILNDWDASYWTPEQLGEFTTSLLRPALDKQGLKTTKIMSGEAAAWATANSLLTDMDKSKVDILAGHGYVEIADLIFGKRGLNQRPKPWDFNTKGKQVWLTETSEDGAEYNSTMKAGLNLATSMHKFLAECNVNAFVYWLGMLNIKNQEALICTNSDGNLEFPKTYDVMGQFSRYIHAGYIRFNADVVNGDAVKVSAYKDPKSDKFSIVVINTGDKEIKCSMNLKGFLAGNLNGYITADNVSGHWQKTAPIKFVVKGNFDVNLPPLSVVTYTGTKKP
jgi:glucuronoarabinoxylan endo-1,4-beta-xylanase